MIKKVKTPPLHFYFNCYKPIVWKFIPYIKLNTNLIWKDKYSTPRVELLPSLVIEWLWFEIRIIHGSDSEWEWYLWFTKYEEFHDGTIEGAKNAYPWKKDGEYSYNSERRRKT